MYKTFRKGLDLSWYEQTIRLHIWYVFVKSSQYTNNKRDVEYIAIYTYVTTYLLLEALEYEGSIEMVLDCMIDIIGKDVSINGSKVTGHDRFSGFELFLADKKTRQLATVLNMLDPFSIQILVLYHIEMLNTKEIGQLYDKSIVDTRLAIMQAEKEMVEKFAGLMPDNAILVLDDVSLWMVDLGETLDLKNIEKITDSVIDFLSMCKYGFLSRKKRFFPYIFN